MGYCTQETSTGATKQKGTTKESERGLGDYNAVAEIRHSVEGLEDKVSEINQGIEPKGHEMENKREMIRHLEDQLKKTSFDK